MAGITKFRHNSLYFTFDAKAIYYKYVIKWNEHFEEKTEITPRKMEALINKILKDCQAKLGIY